PRPSSAPAEPEKTSRRARPARYRRIPRRARRSEALSGRPASSVPPPEPSTTIASAGATTDAPASQAARRLAAGVKADTMKSARAAAPSRRHARRGDEAVAGIIRAAAGTDAREGRVPDAPVRSGMTKRCRRWLAWLIASGVVASVAYTNRRALATAVQLMAPAELRWLIPAAVATLLLGALIYLTVVGILDPGRLSLALVPGATLAGLAAWLYVLQRDRRRLTSVALGAARHLARALGRRWPEESVRGFLDEYYAGKDIIRRRPGAFCRMLGLQYLAVGCDATALYMAFLALGQSPQAWVVLL